MTDTEDMQAENKRLCEMLDYILKDNFYLSEDIHDGEALFYSYHDDIPLVAVTDKNAISKDIIQRAKILNLELYHNT